MITKIKDLKYIKQDSTIIKILDKYDLNESAVQRILKGVSNRDKITIDSTFDVIDWIDIEENSKYGYYLLENNLGIFPIREDNIVQYKELDDIKASLGIDKIIKAGNKTILISDDSYYCDKIVTERDTFDKDDIVKAIMICLLKRDGYNINDIYTVADSVRYIKVPPKRSNKS